MIKNYVDALRIADYMINKDEWKDSDTESLAGVMVRYIMEHSYPEDAASMVIRQLSAKLKSELDREMCGHNIEHSSMMAKRYAHLITCIGANLGKMTFPIDERTKGFLLSLAPEPQQKPNEGAGGELADSEPKTLSEPTETTTAGNDDQQGENSDDQYIKLPLGMQTPGERAERIFTAATDEGYMEADEQHGTWIGKGNISNRTHEVVARKRQLAYLCKLVYGDIPPWTAIEEYFNEKGLAHEYGNIKNYPYNSIPTWQKALDNLKSKAL